MTLRAFAQYDLPVLLGSVIIGAVVLVLMNLIVDIIYTVLDPRVRLGSARPPLLARRKYERPDYSGAADRDPGASAA